MNETIKQPTQTRPVGSDMTMDEILSSIRKIISTEDHLKPEPAVKTDAQQNMPKAEAPKIRVPLSSKEQLRSLSTPLSDDINNISENWQVSHQDAAPRKIEPNRLHQNIDPPMAPTSHYNDDTSEILKTLEEIKKSLSAESLQKISNVMTENPETKEQETTQTAIENTLNNTQDPVLHNAQINDPHQLQNIDFKPVHFGQDDIPDFLKKFKKEQTETQNITSPEENESYSFKEVPSFEDDNAIIELTEALNDPVILSDIAEKTTSELISQKEKMPKAMQKQDPEDNDDDMSDVLEMLMIKSLRPMLKEWVEDNIADIAQKVLREELHKRGQKNKA